MFATTIHFRPSLIFVGKAMSTLSVWSNVRGSSLVSSSLTCEYWPHGKHTSLVQYGNIYGCNMFYSSDSMDGTFKTSYNYLMIFSMMWCLELSIKIVLCTTSLKILLNVCKKFWKYNPWSLYYKTFYSRKCCHNVISIDMNMIVLYIHNTFYKQLKQCFFIKQS